MDIQNWDKGNKSYKITVISPTKLGRSSIKGEIISRPHHAEYICEQLQRCFNSRQDAYAAELCHPMGRIENNPLQMVVLAELHHNLTSMPSLSRCSFTAKIGTCIPIKEVSSTSYWTCMEIMLTFSLKCHSVRGHQTEHPLKQTNKKKTKWILESLHKNHDRISRLYGRWSMQPGVHQIQTRHIRNSILTSRMRWKAAKNQDQNTQQCMISK